MAISIEQLTLWLGMFLWPFFRIAAMMSAISVFGSRLVPQLIRLLFSCVITISIFKLLPPMPTLDALSLNTMILIAQQIIIGLAFGFIIQMVFQIFVIGGQLIAMQAGLGFASMIDPQNGVSVPVVSQFYLMLITLLYLSMDGHLVMIKMIIESFDYLPVGVNGLPLSSIWAVINFMSWMFAKAVMVALPAVSALLIVNIAFGVMTRSAPQLNIFTIGFPITLVIGLCVIYFTLPNVLQLFNEVFVSAIELIKSQLLVGGSNVR